MSASGVPVGAGTKLGVNHNAARPQARLFAASGTRLPVPAKKEPTDIAGTRPTASQPLTDPTATYVYGGEFIVTLTVSNGTLTGVDDDDVNVSGPPPPTPTPTPTPTPAPTGGLSHAAWRVRVHDPVLV